MRRIMGIGAFARGLCMLLAFAGHANAGGQEEYERGLLAYQQDDLITAMQFLEAAADGGHAEAQSLLGYILDQAEQNQQALHWYRQAADNGSATGAYRLASMYAAGDGVERDVEQAVHWYRAAAADDYGPALEQLALARMHGQLGLEPDRVQAVELLRRAVAAGYEPAKSLLAAAEAGQ